jgi:hypothetical protein
MLPGPELSSRPAPPAPVQRGSFACSASSHGPEMSTSACRCLPSAVVVGSVSVVTVGTDDAPSSVDDPTAATTTAAKIPRSATESVSVIALRMSSPFVPEVAEACEDLDQRPAKER